MIVCFSSCPWSAMCSTALASWEVPLSPVSCIARCWCHCSVYGVWTLSRELLRTQWISYTLGIFIQILTGLYINGLVQERHNSIANALELRLSCTNPSIWGRTGMHSVHCYQWYLSILPVKTRENAQKLWHVYCGTVFSWIHLVEENVTYIYMSMTVSLAAFGISVSLVNIP